MGILLEGLLFSPTEWLLIFGVVLLLFGGKKIPEVMHGLGTGIKNFKQAMKEDEEEVKPAGTPKAQPPALKNQASGQSAETKTTEP